MRCARLHAPGDIRVAEVPEPTPGPGESLVRVTGVGLCGSDLHWFTEGAIGDAVLGEPLVLGHEIAGVALTGPLAGQPVGLDPAVPCGQCPECDRALEHLCARMAFAGHGRTHGGLRERLAWPDRHLHPLPADTDPAVGALLEPLGVAVHSVDLAHLRPGWTVAVVGCGPIGLMLVALAAAAGARVVAVEPLAHRRTAALAAGAAVALDPDEPDVPDVPGGPDGSGGPGGEQESRCDVVFEVSGADAGLDRAAALARPGARIVMVGIPDGDRSTLRASTVRRKGLTLAWARRMTADAYRRGIDLVARGALDLSPLATHRFELADAAAAFAVAARREGLKVVVTVDP